MKYHLFLFNIIWSDNYQGSFVGFRFMMFTQVLMKELACILIHVHKIFNCRVSFKMFMFLVIVSMFLVIVEKEIWKLLWLSTFQSSSFGKITIIVVKVALIQVSFPNDASKQENKNENMEYHDIFMAFKCQIYSKYGSDTFFLSESCSLVL